MEKYGSHRAKHTGDGIFVLFNGPTKAVRCALDLVPALATRGIRIRAGVHIGECERRGEEWSGTAVHVGARIGAMARRDEVLTSRTVRDLSAGSGLRFEGLRPIALRDSPQTLRSSGSLRQHRPNPDESARKARRSLMLLVEAIERGDLTATPHEITRLQGVVEALGAIVTEPAAEEP